MQAAPPVAAPVRVSTTAQKKEHYMSKAVLALSVTQIIIGALCFFLQLFLTVIDSGLYFFAQGIWTGLFFILTGAFGIASSKKKTTRLIVTFLVLAIISAVLTVATIIITSLDMIIYSIRIQDSVGYKDAPFIISAVMVFLAVTQAVVAIISSALGCHGLCGGNQNKSVVMVGQVQCVQGPDGQQQMVLLPLHQQESGLATGPRCHPDQAQLPPYDPESPPPKYECETKPPIPL